MSKLSRDGGKTSRPSSNWLALQKNLPGSKQKDHVIFKDGGPRKRRKIQHHSSTSPASGVLPTRAEASSFPRGTVTTDVETEVDFESHEMKNGESISQLRKMVFGKLEYTPVQRLPGKYLSLDCEMVGVGIEGVESSLARVSLVNYYGALQLDEFVRQRERVVDYRTQWSGIRETDMIKAKPFEEVQKQVAEILKDRILVGHAVFNDLKALLLSHPRPQTRDTQYHAGRHKLLNTKYPALRNLVKQELDITIQGGEHSSVTDARATMAVYRLHRKEWEKGMRPLSEHGSVSKKRKRPSRTAGDDGGDGDNEEGQGQGPEQSNTFPGGGRKGVSSGLSIVTRRSSGSRSGGDEKSKWWKELGGRSNKSKGSIRLKTG